MALSFTSVANKEGKLVEYVYPLKTDGKATSTLEEFAITAVIKSEHNVTNVYSPTHSISLKRANDKEVAVTFDKNQGLLDKDFQLFYATGNKDVGLTALTHRPLSGDKGFFTLLITPRVEIPKEYRVPRDVVLVLDTSGSMMGAKMEQARKALKFCLGNLGKNDRFGLINFATTVNRYEDKLLDANAEQLARAKKWVEELEATGGTAINDALASALELRTKDEGRTFTVVFFTDGRPTIGETDADKILKNTTAKNTANTRIFTFGVGDDVNATMLDQLAERTRALSTYVRPAEDIENKVSGLYGKISNPVLTNLKLSATNDIKFSEVYPPELPDLFHGGQLVVLGRYSGKGPAAIKLSGQVGMETKGFVYELTFPDKTNDDREFVEHLWARRKVGFLLDQIRANGENKELVSEVVGLAKKYGIATPYTSYLVVPDGPMPVVGNRRGRFAPTPPLNNMRNDAPGGAPDVRFSGGGMMGMGGMSMMGMGGGMMGMGGMSMMGMGYGMTGMSGGFAGMPSTIMPVPSARAAGGDRSKIALAPLTPPRHPLTNPTIALASYGILGGRVGGSMMGGMMGMGGFGGMAPMYAAPKPLVEPRRVADIAKEVSNKPDTASQERLKVEDEKYRRLSKDALPADIAARERLDAYRKAGEALKEHRQAEVQAGKLGVDLSVQTRNLRNQSRLEQTAVRRVWGRECLEMDGLWIDQGFTPKTPTLIVKAQSDAYFKLLERQPKLREVFRLGNRLVWVAPSGTALILDTREGKEKLSDDEIDKLFVAAK